MAKLGGSLTERQVVLGEVGEKMGPFDMETAREFVTAEFAGYITVAPGKRIASIGNESIHHSHIFAESHEEALAIVVDDKLAIGAINTFLDMQR